MDRSCREAVALLPTDPDVKPRLEEEEVLKWRRRWRYALLAIPILLGAAALQFRREQRAFTLGLQAVKPIKLPNVQQLISLASALDPGEDVLKTLGLHNSSDSFHRLVNRTLQDAGFEPIRQVPNAFAAEEFDPSANIGLAVCVVDVGQTFFQLGQGLMAINAASRSCLSGPNVSAADKQACSISVSYAIAGIVWAISFATDAISQCAGSLDLQAACATDLNVMLGSWAYLSSAVSAMVLNCKSSIDKIQSYAQVGARRLGEPPEGDVKVLAPDPFTAREASTEDVIEYVKQIKADQADRAALKATCFFDVGHAAFWVARVGTSITQATLDCTEQNFASAGEGGKSSCSVDVSGVVGAAAFAGSTIALTVAGCPAALDKDNSNTFCAAAIIDTVGLAAYLAQSFSSIGSTCGALAQHV
mmetsp:Transcript_3768/g.8793  ORF Transcript_3768/g.8793 Transcript_3768/m.8793 type:complete len:418 (+) Transcript_3768:9-1262(+)